MPPLPRPCRSHRLAPLAGLLLALSWSSASVASPLTPDSDEGARRTELGAELSGGKLLWVNSGKIWFSELEPWAPQMVTQGALEESRPRWSPDGTQILFARQLIGVLVMDADFNDERVLIAGATTADWADDGRAVTAIAGNEYEVIKYDLIDDSTSVIFDARQPPYNGQPISQAAELHPNGRYLLTFRVDPEHVTEVVDLMEQTYISNAQMERGDCSPAWSPDGTYLLNTARTGSRPVLRAEFDAGAGTVSDSSLFASIADICDCTSFYIHGQRVSNDGAWVTFGGWIKDGPKSNGHREIYVWKIGEPHDTAVRLTFDTAEDHSPSLWVSGGVTDPPPTDDPTDPPPDSGENGLPSSTDGDGSQANGTAADREADPVLYGGVGCTAAGRAPLAALLLLLLLRRRRR